jgi:protein involved in polysaccharide export with SLBB domain
VVAVMLAAAAARAQTGAGTPSTPTPSMVFGQTPVTSLEGVEGPIISETYIVMPGDKLLVTISGPAAYSYETWVTYEGKVTLNMPVTSYNSADPAAATVDAVRISGLTLQHAQDTLNKEFGRYFLNAQVKLTLTRLRTGIVFVTGEVRFPGAYDASPVERVSQVIAKAGGLSPLGSKTSINLNREGQLHSIVDIERFENDGILEANPFVQSGDIIQVPAVSGLVTVKGAVFGRGEYRLRTSALTTEKERISEGIYELKPGEKIFDIIRKAGGITPWADLTNAYVERLIVGGDGARKKILIDLHAIIFERDSTQNIELMNTDMLVVPPINTLVYVEGEVDSPGPFTFTPNQRSSQYVGQAGGPTNYAHMRGSYILRNGKKLSMRDDPVVEPGDIVMVPRTMIKWWQDYVTIISAIGIPVASILVTVSLTNR